MLIDKAVFKTRKVIFGLFVILINFSISCQAEKLEEIRETVDINPNWEFSRIDQFGLSSVERVNIPHSWNSKELWDSQRGMALSLEYQRGEGVYKKAIELSETYKDKRIFLKFGGANLVTRVSLNGQYIGEHRGGYSAFVFEITDFVALGEENVIEVAVDNSLVSDIAPLQGDFNVYGGLIRPVSLIVTDQVNVSVLDNGSSGIFISQKQVSAEKASVEILTKIDHGGEVDKEIAVRAVVRNAEGQIVYENQLIQHVTAGDVISVKQPFELVKPRLWDGTNDPYLYRVSVTLLDGDRPIDQVVQPLGLRDIVVDPQRGVFLNGKRIKLKGVAFHEDWAGSGAALSLEQRKTDMKIISDMGANALRLAHYPHGSDTIKLADEYGFLVWAEIPFIGFPIGPIGGYTDSEAFRTNLRQQLVEMIRQNYNHPSVAFWGLYNELPNTEGPFDSRQFLREVQAIAKAEDPYRVTTSAAFETDLDLEINNITDIQFWNRYFGWYYGDVNSLGPWLDDTHAKMPARAIGVSEYGSGANIDHQLDKLKKPYGLSDPFHPENWQAHQHEGAWRDLAERDFPVGSFIWAMFDFSSYSRHEGSEPGLNDKGLVTYDRQVKKDAYYFYQANWSDKPMIHLSGKRNTNPASSSIDIKVYSNLAELELWVNGESHGKTQPDEINRFIWPDIALVDGNTTLRVVGYQDGVAYEDRAVWYRSMQAQGSAIATVVFSERYKLVPAIILILIFLYFRGFKLSATPGGSLIAKSGFYTVSLFAIMYFAALFYMWQAGYLMTFN